MWTFWRTQTKNNFGDFLCYYAWPNLSHNGSHRLWANNYLCFAFGELLPSSPPHFFVGNVIMHDPFDCRITLNGNLSNLASATWLISQETWALLIRMSSPHIYVMISVVFLLLLDRDWISITVSSLPIIDLSLPRVLNPFWVLVCDLSPASKNLHQYMAAHYIGLIFSYCYYGWLRFPWC